MDGPQEQEMEAQSPSPPPFNPLHCSPCDRTLASKELFDRHVLSELHFKRTSLGQQGTVSSLHGEMVQLTYFCDSAGYRTTIVATFCQISMAEFSKSMST